MVSITRTTHSATVRDGMRPVNLRADLAPLADLIELVFADSMDSSGRAALREMRYMSRVGFGLGLLSRMNGGAFGINLGYVWIADNRLVGNVSVYAANFPAEVGSTWIIANVGVHPQYQRRGIARQLMRASMDMIRQRKGTAAILQVDADNFPARNLYHSLGFIDERTWITWQRYSSMRLPPAVIHPDVYIRHRRRTEWQAEMRLAARIRPQAHGGLGWLRPLHASQFRKSLWGILSDWISLQGTERLVAASKTDDHLLGSLWIENAFASKTRLTLLVDPAGQGIYDELLLQNAIRRLGRSTLVIETPADEQATASVLKRNHFVPQREVVHMRWDAW